MRQAIHIFKKDVRQFRYEIAAVLLLLMKFGYEVKETQLVNHPSSLWQALLVVAWCLLIVRVIHGEALPGDRQFWITRPYDRRSLLAAKMLFLLTFITLPLLLAQAVIVVANGYALPAGGLLWNQILLVLVFILPAAALASVTVTLPQFVLGALAILAWIIAAEYLSEVGATLANFVDNLGPLDWIRVSAMVGTILLTALPILILQFMRRKTTVSRIIAVVGTVLIPAIPYVLPWGALLDFQFPANPIPSLHVELDRSKSGIQGLPFQMTGLPEGTEFSCDAAAVVIEGPQGRWRSGLISPVQIATFVSPSKRGCAVRVQPNQFPFDAAGSQPVKIRASFYLTLFGNKRSIALARSGPRFPVPGLGLCASVSSYIACGSPFRRPERLVRTTDGNNPDLPFPDSLSYSPFPAALHIAPIERFGVSIRDWRRTAVNIEDALVHFRYDVEENGVHLEDFPPAPEFVPETSFYEFSLTHP